MDSDQTAFLREVLAGTPWFGECREFAEAMRTAPRNDGGLLLVGTPGEEPWHLAAHLDTEAGLSGLTRLSPTLVRHAVPLGAPPHLSVGLDRLTASRGGEAVLVVAPDEPGERLLDRVEYAKRHGATILALADADTNDELTGLAHERLLVPSDGPVPGFDAAQHVLALAAGEAVPLPRGFRDRMARVLDRISGPAAADW